MSVHFGGIESGHPCGTSSGLGLLVFICILASVIIVAVTTAMLIRRSIKRRRSGTS